MPYRGRGSSRRRRSERGSWSSGTPNARKVGTESRGGGNKRATAHLLDIQEELLGVRLGEVPNNADVIAPLDLKVVVAACDSVGAALEDLPDGARHVRVTFQVLVEGDIYHSRSRKSAAGNSVRELGTHQEVNNIPQHLRAALGRRP